MWKRFQLWWFVFTLNRKFKKDGKWIIDLPFVHYSVLHFRTEWLTNYTNKDGYKTFLFLHYNQLHLLLSIIEDLTIRIKEDQSIALVSSHYDSFPQKYTLVEYLVDDKNRSIDIVDLELHLKRIIIALVTELQNVKSRSTEVGYSYYQRTTKMVISDILEIYWGFLEIARNLNR